MAMSETSVVPATSGRTPKRGTAKSGVHSVPVRNSTIDTSRRNDTVSIVSTTMMPIVVPIDSRAQRKRPHSITNSNRFIADGSLLAREQLFQGESDLRAAGAERRPDLAIGEVLLGQVVDLRRQLDVADFAHQRLRAEI